MRPDKWSCLEFHLEACPCERSYSCCWLYFWFFLSSDRPFQVYYKVRQVSLQSTTDFFLLLQSATGITKWDDDYKVRQNRPTLCIDFISWRENLVADIYFTKLRMNIKGNKTKFIDFYLRFRIGTLFHTSNVILQDLYCVTITEHELLVMSWKIY